MISEADVNSILECTGGRETYWVRMVRQYAQSRLGDSGCEKLKEAILADFSAWGLLGSFLTSIAFGMVIIEQSDDRTVDLFSLYGAYIIIFMYAALMSLHSVIAGTFKYIYFSGFPPTVVVPAIVDYLSSEMNSGMEARKDIFTTTRRKFLPHKWDHMTPMIYSMYAISIGFTIAVQMISKNYTITIVIALISVIFASTVADMRKDMWMRQKIYQDLRPQEFEIIADDDVDDNCDSIDNSNNCGDDHQVSPTPRRSPRKTQANRLFHGHSHVDLDAMHEHIAIHGPHAFASQNGMRRSKRISK